MCPNFCLVMYIYTYINRNIHLCVYVNIYFYMYFFISFFLPPPLTILLFLSLLSPLLSPPLRSHTPVCTILIHDTYTSSQTHLNILFLITTITPSGHWPTTSCLTLCYYLYFLTIMNHFVSSCLFAFVVLSAPACFVNLITNKKF